MKKGGIQWAGELVSILESKGILKTNRKTNERQIKGQIKRQSRGKSRGKSKGKSKGKAGRNPKGKSTVDRRAGEHHTLPTTMGWSGSPTGDHQTLAPSN